MSVWFVIPSIRPNGGTCPKWREIGYKIAVLRQGEPFPEANVTLGTDRYEGHARSVNTLVKWVMGFDKEAQWFVTGGDDTDPDLNHTPDEIADQCTDHFKGTFGVLQPTGDRWGDDAASRAQFGPDRGAFIDRICGSPWMGRQFCERINGGRGPFWPEYTHMFADEEMQEVCQRLSIFWQRPDLIHLHHHFTRVGDSVDWVKGRQVMPEFLQEANTPGHWQKYSALFRARKEAGFPGHEPLPLPTLGPVEVLA